MTVKEKGDKSYTLEELEEMFGGKKEPGPDGKTDDKQTVPPVTPPTEPAKDDKNEKVEQIVARRLKEETSKLKSSERDAVAIENGYKSYADMQEQLAKKAKEQEAELLKAKGLDNEETLKTIDELVAKRLANSATTGELEELRQLKADMWIKNELEEVKKLTGGDIKEVNQLTKEEVDLAKKLGSLKAAYLQLHGEELLVKARAGLSKGTTSHLGTPPGSPGSLTETKRPMTAKERDVYKLFNPDTKDEDLDKKLVDK